MLLLLVQSGCVVSGAKQRDASSHESSVNWEQDGRVMIWVMQAGPWGFLYSLS